MRFLRVILFFLGYFLRRAAFAVFVLTALALFAATLMASLGEWRWIEIPLAYDGQPVPYAGMIVQIGLTVLAMGLLFFLPANTRMMQLENSHREFSIGMEDVARAYGAVHAADRKDVFTLSSEFDSVRERLAHLRQHPDLGGLEPGLLEVAAQMSHLSRELADVYSDEKVARARSFLAERQQEIEDFNTRLARAKEISAELKQWDHELQLEENVAAAQLDRIKLEIAEFIPELNGKTHPPKRKKNNKVIDMKVKAAE